MKIPSNKKLIAVVNKDKPIFNAMDLFNIQDKDTFTLNEGEVKCEVEIKFTKWLK